MNLSSKRSDYAVSKIFRASSNFWSWRFMPLSSSSFSAICWRSLSASPSTTSAGVLFFHALRALAFGAILASCFCAVMTFLLEYVR